MNCYFPSHLTVPFELSISATYGLKPYLTWVNTLLQSTSRGTTGQLDCTDKKTRHPTCLNVIESECDSMKIFSIRFSERRGATENWGCLFRVYCSLSDVNWLDYSWHYKIWINVNIVHVFALKQIPSTNKNPFAATKCQKKKVNGNIVRFTGMVCLFKITCKNITNFWWDLLLVSVTAHHREPLHGKSKIEFSIMCSLWKQSDRSMSDSSSTLECNVPAYQQSHYRKSARQTPLPLFC